MAQTVTDMLNAYEMRGREVVVCLKSKGQCWATKEDEGAEMDVATSGVGTRAMSECRRVKGCASLARTCLDTEEGFHAIDTRMTPHRVCHRTPLHAWLMR
jgi:hypothetical protein